MRSKKSWSLTFSGALLALLGGCGDEPESVGAQRAALVAVCTEDAATAPAGAWLCGTPRTVECDTWPGTASPGEIYVVHSEGCAGPTLLVDEGPFALGENEVVVTQPLPSGAVELCRSTLLVVDTTPPLA